MNLFIIRHSIAVDIGTPGIENDSMRTLTDKGRKRMQEVARGLQALDVSFDRILTSPYLRALETAEILADYFQMRPKLEIIEHLTPVSDPDNFISEIQEKYSKSNLAIVSHEPFISAFISILLTGTPSMLIEVKKAGVCCLQVGGLDNDWHAILAWFLTPAQLIKIGSLNQS